MLLGGGLTRFGSSPFKAPEPESGVPLLASAKGWIVWKWASWLPVRAWMRSGRSTVLPPPAGEAARAADCPHSTLDVDPVVVARHHQEPVAGPEDGPGVGHERALAPDDQCDHRVPGQSQF
jgi:hypothetical protein